MGAEEARVWFVGIVTGIVLLGFLIYWLIKRVHDRWDKEKAWHEAQLHGLGVEQADVKHDTKRIRQTLLAVWRAATETFTGSKRGDD